MIELHRKLPVFDIINFVADATSIVPPAGAPITRYTKPDEQTYKLENGDVYKYSEATRDLALVAREHTPEFNIEDYQSEPVVSPPDPSSLRGR